jgi:hypothetical protein
VHKSAHYFATAFVNWVQIDNNILVRSSNPFPYRKNEFALYELEVNIMLHNFNKEVSFYLMILGSRTQVPYRNSVSLRALFAQIPGNNYLLNELNTIPDGNGCIVVKKLHIQLVCNSL